MAIHGWWLILSQKVGMPGPGTLRATLRGGPWR